ncbi:MAG: carboxypeptidase regulatory-like domain-containing protein [Acidobacteria bacterium]|nr:carboxypeptidase regulatory-like domain-containing protein [Acidobacteriota bacterium]
MGYTPHLTRRQILESIPVLGAGSLLLPLNGQRPDTRTPATIRGRLLDGATGQPVAAKIRVTNTASGEAYLPAHAIQTMPQRTTPGVRHYFYARGAYEVAVPPGRYRIEAVRGICHDEAVAFTEVGPGLTHVEDLRIPVLRRLPGWYSGNTHTHYHLEIGEDPDDRLRLVPPAEALDVSVISYLIRNDAPYITNRYPIGRLPQFSRDGTLMDMGEEARNNKTFGEIGYGHCLFLNIPRAIEPVSTGLLSKDGQAPDFPTLSMLCEEARRIGGTTVWCHNGAGMELPVAAALGHLDAYNLADGLDADYRRYYRLLNCGFALPASSGTDWWIYDHNRVFVQVEGGFTYDNWIAGLRAGRTFVSNGPLLDLKVDGRGPGSTVAAGAVLRVTAQAISRLPFDRLEIVQDGEVVAEQSAVGGREARLEREIPTAHGGWLAARAVSRAKTHALTTVFAHTSPVYLRIEGTPHRRAQDAGAFVDEIEESLRFIRKSYKFASQADLAVAVGRFEQGRRVYGKLAAEGG